MFLVIDTFPVFVHTFSSPSSLDPCNSELSASELM